MLQATVEKLEQQIKSLTMSGVKRERKLWDSSLLKKAMERLEFDVENVHRSIDTWNYFFNLYSVDSDFDKFLAVEQLLPSYMHRALALNEKFSTSYKWLITYLKDNYSPKYICHEMERKCIEEFSDINELESLAMEAANAPREELIKHFMMQSCSQEQKVKMKPFLYQSMKEFKFQFKLMLDEDANRCSVTMRNSCPESKTIKMVPCTSASLLKQVSLNDKWLRTGAKVMEQKRQIVKSSVDVDGTRKGRELQRHVGWFCCESCSKSWVCQNLLCVVGEGSGVSRRCFNCQADVVPRRVQMLKRVEHFQSRVNNAVTKVDQNDVSATSSGERRWEHCFHCGKSGHIACDCNFNRKVCFICHQEGHFVYNCSNGVDNNLSRLFRESKSNKKLECEHFTSWKWNKPRGETLYPRRMV